MTRFNFKGYNLFEWLKGNKSTIEEAVKVGVPAIIAWMITKNYIETGIATIIGKFILDTIHYWVNK